MAPKTIAKAALYLSTSRVPLYDLSTGPESGWRPLNVKRVAELAEVILKVDFGNTVLGKPSLLCGQDGKARRMGLSVESWFCGFAEPHYGSSSSRNQLDNLENRVASSQLANSWLHQVVSSWHV